MQLIQPWLKPAVLSWEVSQTLSLPMVLNTRRYLPNRSRHFYKWQFARWSDRRLLVAYPRASRRSRWSLVSDVGSPLKGSHRLLTTRSLISRYSVGVSKATRAILSLVLLRCSHHTLLVKSASADCRPDVCLFGRQGKSDKGVSLYAYSQSVDTR